MSVVFLGVLLCVLLFIVLARKTVMTVNVRGSSMEPALADGNRVLAFSGPIVKRLKVGDVVVAELDATRVRARRQMPSRVVKRLAAIGPTSIAFPDDPNIPKYYGQFERTVNNGTAEYKVPLGHVFVVSDNRDHGVDSRTFGPIPIEFIVGRTGNEPIQLRSRRDEFKVRP